MKIKYVKTKLILTAVYLLIIAVFAYFKIPCIYLTVFGIPCPGCGMTRALISALKFDFKAAFSYHFMFWSVPILYLYFWADGSVLLNKTCDRILLSLIAAGFVINWIAAMAAQHLCC